MLGGISSKKMEANTVLSLTNVRTTETIAVQDGYAAKNSISFGGGGGYGFFGGGAAAVGGGYDNTDIGRIVTLAFIQAYTKMVTELGLVRPAPPARPGRAGQDLHRASPGGNARQRRPAAKGSPDAAGRRDRLSDRGQERPVVGSRRRE